MAHKYGIDDEAHAEEISVHDSLSEARAELTRLARTPWNHPPNQAPCTNWQHCGRRYELVAYEESDAGYRELSRLDALAVDASGPKWLTEGLQ